MNALIFALYALSHCVGFAGFALMIALRAYDDESADRMLAYNLFLVSFFAYLLPPNVAFFARSFLGSAALTGEPWYYVADVARTTLLMTAASYFFWRTPTKTAPRATLVFLLILSQLPIAGLLVQAILIKCLGLSAGAIAAVRLMLMRGHVFLIAGLLAWSCAYLKTHRAYAVDDECGKMMDLTIIGNLAFIPVFVGVSFLNFGPDRTWLPLCAENVYYAAVHAANVAVLALRGFTTPEISVPSRPRGEDPFPEAAQRHVLSLSGRERDIIELMAQGLANKQIAGELLVSEHAIRNQMHRLFKRFGVRNRVELAELYRRLTVQSERPRR